MQVSSRAYQDFISEINGVLASAHDPKKSLLDNLLAVLTLYISPKVIGSHFDRVSEVNLSE